MTEKEITNQQAKYITICKNTNSWDPPEQMPEVSTYTVLNNSHNIVKMQYYLHFTGKRTKRNQ